MENAAKTTEQVVREAISANYDKPEFLYDERLIRHLVHTIEDPTMNKAAMMEEASPAAAWVYSSLWSTDYIASPAAQATRDLFCALGRQDELGPLND